MEAGNGALENTRALLKEVGPITVPLLPKLPPPPKPQPAPPPQVSGIGGIGGEVE